MRLPEAGTYFERYGYFKDHGDGSMLVFWTGNRLEYVLFTPLNSFRKTVISKELLDKYKREIVGVQQ